MSTRKITVGAVVAAVGLALSGCGASGDDGTPVQSEYTGEQDRGTTSYSDPTTDPEPTTDPAPTTEAPPTTTEPEIPVELRNAIGSARSYVEMMGFSKQGLIEQLSSEYGEGYPTDVATKAVERLDVDWKEEAVESANSYMNTMSFSRSGLIEQLSSEYGEGFTRSQAEYAADEVF